MNPRKRIILLVLIMVTIVFCVELSTIGILYKTAITEERERLEETAKSQARLIEAVARFDRNYSGGYPYGAWQATIDQIQDAHSRYRGFGKTGKFTLSKMENDQIIIQHNGLRRALNYLPDNRQKDVPLLEVN